MTGLQELLKMYFTVILFNVRTKTKDFYAFHDWQLIKSKSIQIPSGVFFVFDNGTVSTVIHCSGKTSLPSQNRGSTLSWYCHHTIAILINLLQCVFAAFSGLSCICFLCKSVERSVYEELCHSDREALQHPQFPHRSYRWQLRNGSVPRYLITVIINSVIVGWWFASKSNYSVG